MPAKQKKGGGPKPRPQAREAGGKGGLRNDEVARLRKILEAESKKEEDAKKLEGQKEMQRVMRGMFNEFATHNGMEALPDADSGSEETGTDDSDSKTSRKKLKRQRQKARKKQEKEELLKYRAGQPEAANVTQVAAMLGEVRAMVSGLKKATPPPVSPAKSVVSVKSKELAKLVEDRVRRVEEAQVQSKSQGQTLVFTSQEEMDRHLESLVHRRLKQKGLSAKERIPAVENQSRFEAQVDAYRHSRDRLGESTDLLEAKLTVLEYLPPDKKKEFLEALEQDGAERIRLFGQITETMLENAEDSVLPQAENVWTKYHSNFKPELLEICERLKVEPKLVDGLTGKQLMCLLLATVRVLPHNK